MLVRTVFPALLLSLSGLSACGDDTTSTGSTGSGGSGGGAATSGSSGSTSSSSSGTSTASTSTASSSSGGGSTTATTTTATTSTGTGGEGGAGGATVATSTSSGTGGEGGAGGSPVTSSSSTNSGGGGSGAGDCAEVALVDVDLETGDGTFLVFSGDVDPPLVDDADISRIELYDPPIGVDGGTPGTYDLGAGADDNYAYCSRCILLITDIDGGTPTLYFQRSGELVVQSVDLANSLASVSMTDVILEEVTIDEDAFSTPVPGGACVRITDADLQLGPSEICDSGLSGGDQAVDVCIEAEPGACAAFESCTASGIDVQACVDCVNAGGGALCDAVLQVIYDTDCFTPTAWTCADDDFWDGATCDCGCGAADPDCSFDTNPVVGCGAGEVCSGDVCLPDAWICEGIFFGTDDGCDCGCGVLDPDCASADDTDCEYCIAPSCGNDGTPGGCNLALIVDGNNAICP